MNKLKKNNEISWTIAIIAVASLLTIGAIVGAISVARDQTTRERERDLVRNFGGVI